MEKEERCLRLYLKKSKGNWVKMKRLKLKRNGAESTMGAIISEVKGCIKRIEGAITYPMQISGHQLGSTNKYRDFDHIIRTTRTHKYRNFAHIIPQTPVVKYLYLHNWDI